MKLYNTNNVIILQAENDFYLIHQQWDSLVNRNRLYQHLQNLLTGLEKLGNDDALHMLEIDLLPPIGQQEVWAAGVTYLRSRDARKEESQNSGGSDLYDKVYEAPRPELFFKSMPHRVCGHGQTVHIRRHSSWNVPEPELTLYISSSGSIEGYTIGNDMSSRSIEGENALYLPQAKMYERSAAIGPCLYVPQNGIDALTMIEMTITRQGQLMYKDSVCIDKIKRSFLELVTYLYSETDFHAGCYLMTGTCLVPPNDFTLTENDSVEIRIDGIGTLFNRVAFKSTSTKKFSTMAP